MDSSNVAGIASVAVVAGIGVLGLFVLLFVIIVVANRAEPDPRGLRPLSVYLFSMSFVMLQITAVPVAEWNGLPAGEPIRWFPSAVCVFDDNGHMLSETVYGSFPPIMDGYRRVQEFLASRT